MGCHRQFLRQFASSENLDARGATAGRDEASGPHEDIIRALVDLGYDRKRAAEAVAAIASRPESKAGTLPEADRERELFRRAIVALSGS